MTTDLSRAVIATLVAIFLAVPLANRARVAALTAAALAGWGCASILDRWQGWCIVVSTVVAAAVVARQLRAFRQLATAAAAALAVSVVAMALLDWHAAWTSVGDAAEADGAFVVVAGALLAVFAGGALIGIALRGLAADVTSSRNDLESLVNAGRYIGWLERALLYAFIVAGVPGAAAVVVTAKSIARFPSFSKERFAEYYLIGTLASVVVAAGAAFAVRGILGLGAFG
jgi:hypothetical protein